MAGLSLADCFRAIPDPRAAGGKRHPLAAILNLVAAAMACGMKSLEAIAEFGRGLSPSQIRELGFTHARPPCKATLSNVLRRLDLTAAEQQLRLWASQRAGQPLHIALDGKTARGSVDGTVPAVHLLSAYAVETGVVLATSRRRPSTLGSSTSIRWYCNGQPARSPRPMPSTLRRCSAYCVTRVSAALSSPQVIWPSRLVSRPMA